MLIERFQRAAFVAVLMGALGACAAEGTGEGFAKTDPYEATNRSVLKGNIRVDRYVLRPAAQAYDFVAPTLVKHLIGNGISHLDLVNDFANYALQGDVERGLTTLGRFTLNTVLGAGGLLDPATEFGLSKEGTDFGLTLGVWGVGEGPYLVLPFLGPSTLRDAAGFLVDRGLSPTAYLGPLDAPDLLGPALTGIEFVDLRDRNKDIIDDVLYESVDPYVTIRAGYLQRRRALIAGDEGVEETLPDIFDDEQSEQ